MTNNNQIRVFIPLHKYDTTVKDLLPKAVQSFEDCKNVLLETDKSYEIDFQIVCPPEIESDCKNFIIESGVNDGSVLINNSGKTDFCSQVNFAVSSYKGQWFSILEYDDTYNKKWFKQFNDYLLGREDVAVFLPINRLTSFEENGIWQYGNEAVWAGAFSNELGYIDYDCLGDYAMFNMTGGIIKTDDYKNVGGLKPSIKVAFTYEFLLRLTKKKYRVFVVPKEGYNHICGVPGCLTEIYEKEMASDEASKWFELAKKECKHTEDRNKDISNKVKAELK